MDVSCLLRSLEAFLGAGFLDLHSALLVEEDLNVDFPLQEEMPTFCSSPRVLTALDY